MYGTIHLRRRQIFTHFRPLPPYRRQFLCTIRRQIWQIFYPSPPKTCRRLKWMVPKTFQDVIYSTKTGVKLEFDQLPTTHQYSLPGHI